MAARRFPFGLTVTVLIAFSILIALGVWQLKRLAWKEDILARRDVALTANARPLGEVIAHVGDVDDLNLVRVQTDCSGLAQAPFESIYGLAAGQIVYRLVSACPLPPGGPYDAILVDRGYVLDTEEGRPAVIADAYPAHVVGLLIPPDPGKKSLAAMVSVDRLPTPKPGAPKLWFTRDIKGMAKALGVARPAPLFLVAETSSNPDWPALHPGLPPMIIPNRHFEYALTWFGLAGALTCIYAAMLWRWRQGR